MEPAIEARQQAGGPSTGASSLSGLPPQLASSIVCGGCGCVIDASEPYPFRCPRAGDGGDHVLRRVLDVSRLSFSLEDSEPNPFVRWRGLFHAYHLATANGMSDGAYVELVRDLDGAVAEVDGHGFAVTPPVGSVFVVIPTKGELSPARDLSGLFFRRWKFFRGFGGNVFSKNSGALTKTQSQRPPPGMR